MHDFITKYSKNRDFGYTLIVDVDYPEYLQTLHKCLPCLSEKISIYFLQYKKLWMSRYVITTRFKTWIILIKVHKIIKCK